VSLPFSHIGIHWQPRFCVNPVTRYADTMIDLTVKTLDSQNHVFSLEDDVSGPVPIGIGSGYFSRLILFFVTSALALS